MGAEHLSSLFHHQERTCERLLYVVVVVVLGRNRQSSCEMTGCGTGVKIVTTASQRR